MTRGIHAESCWIPSVMGAIAEHLMSARIAIGLLLAAIIILSPLAAAAADSDRPFVKHALVISAEATFAHFGPRLGDRGLQAWNLSARAALLPFGVTRFAALRGLADGALEVGLEPAFERFTSENQNFAGLGLAARYYLLHFRYGRWVPWIEAGIVPGGTDLRIGRVSNQTRLTGPFMARIQGAVGISYFMTERAAIYAGLQGQHLSNAGLNGANRNYSLNTAESVVVGLSYFIY